MASDLWRPDAETGHLAHARDDLSGNKGKALCLTDSAWRMHPVRDGLIPFDRNHVSRSLLPLRLVRTSPTVVLAL